MLRSEGPSDYRKALLAAGAAVGVGIVAYRLWSRRRPASDGSGSRIKVGAGTPPTQHRVQKEVEDRIPVTSASGSFTQEPATDKREKFTATIGKETINVSTDNNGTDILSTSGTFVKVSPSASPVSFEEIGASYVEPMSMPSTPPLIAEPTSTKLNEANSAAADASIDVLSASSLSFIALSTEQSEAPLSQGGSSDVTLESDTGRNDADVSMTENNDIVVIGSNSDHSSENDSEGVEVDAAAAAVLAASTSALEEELEQSLDTTETQPTDESRDDEVAGVSVDTPEE